MTTRTTCDGASRLYTLTQTLAGSASVTYTLGYNAASQIVSKQVSNSAYVAHPGSITAGYVANGLNQYTSATGITASYVPANSAALSYDPAGRLQTETTAGATTSLLYSGDALVGEYDSSGNIIARYAIGPGVDEPLVWYQGAGATTRNWLTADNQGSVIGYADQGGNAGATYTYGPYGEPIASGGASAWGGSRYRFTGQIEIPEAQLYYYKARVYDPNLGRFQQTDPAGLTSDTNLYAYATQDPVNGSDPSGMDDDDPDPDLQCENGCGVESPGLDDDDDSEDYLFWTECRSGSPGDGSCGITVSPTRYLPPLPFFYFNGGPQGAGGGGGGGGGGKERQTSQPNCNTVLPSGQTICEVVKTAIADTYTPDYADTSPSDATGTILSNTLAFALPFGALDFKNNFRNRGDPTQLAAAGNFAYGAYVAALYGSSVSNFGAELYGTVAKLLGIKAARFLAPNGMSKSGAANVPRGNSNAGC